jgi:hypothetical protein
MFMIIVQRFSAVLFNNIGVSSLKMATAQKHVGAN